MFENVKKMFRKEETVEQKIAREIEEENKKIIKKNKDYVSRQEKIMDCRAALAECYDFFQRSIIIENARNAELESTGLLDSDHRDRVREAAIGMLIAKQAIIKLEHINNDGELNRTINQMGMALRQVQRLDDSTNAISYSTKKTLKRWYPYPLEENIADKEMNTQLAVPQDIRDKIDNDFIDGLIDGDSFDECLMRSVRKSKNKSKLKSDYDAKMDFINDALSDDESAQLDEAMKNKFSDSF